MANYDFLNSPIIPNTSPRAPHVHHRLMVTFIVLAVVIMIGASVYYFGMNQTVSPITTSAPIPVADAKMQYVSKMQQTVQSQPALPVVQKQALLNAMNKKLKNNK